VTPAVAPPHHRTMTTTRSRAGRADPAMAVVLSFVPWIAFLVALALADLGGHTSLGRLATAAPLYLAFVALPSFLPLAAARAWWTRLVALVLMTAAAVAAAILIVTIDDGQAGLAVFLVPEVAIPLGAVIWIGHAIADRRPGPDAFPGERAGVSDRLAALVIDVALVGAALVVPLTAMSHARYEIVAGVVGVSGATLFLAVPVATRGRSIGQSLLGLAVVDTRTLGRISFGRSILRSLVVVLEVTGIPTFILAVPAVAELTAVGCDGRSLTDRLLATSVVTTR